MSAAGNGVASGRGASATGDGPAKTVGGTLKEGFRRFSNYTAVAVGSSWAFVIGVLTIVVWAATGPIFHFSDTWQLVINTGTTIVTFLMVFLIQNSQNRDAKAIQLKLDELIRAMKGARNSMVELEDCTEEELEAIKREFQNIRKREQDRRAKKVAEKAIAHVEVAQNQQERNDAAKVTGL